MLQKRWVLAPSFKGEKTEDEAAGQTTLNSLPELWENQAYKPTLRIPVQWATLETALE